MRCWGTPDPRATGVAQPRTSRSARGRAVLRARATLATAETSRALSPAQVQQFKDQGFLVLERFASAAECAALRRRATELVSAFKPRDVTIFSTTNQAANTNRYFLDSANAVSCFFEEDAFDERGELRQDKELSINKIGHAMHDLDPAFRMFSRSPAVAQLLRDLGYVRPVPVQSMYIFKQPRIGGEVVPHQDSAYLATAPLTCTGLWWALEDATRGNGCLWALPRSHNSGLHTRFVCNDGQVSYERPRPSFDLSAFQPLEVPAGSLVVLQGANVHGSEPNRSATSRHAYSMHVVESARGVTWLPDNWAQPSAAHPWEPLYDDSALPAPLPLAAV